MSDKKDAKLNLELLFISSGFPIVKKEDLCKGKIEIVKEWYFHPVRRWRYDYAIPECYIAVEIEGGTWGKKKSRHTTGKGYEGDCEKYNAGAVLGWSILRYTTNQIIKNPDYVIDDIKDIMRSKK